MYTSKLRDCVHNIIIIPKTRPSIGQTPLTCGHSGAWKVG